MESALASMILITVLLLATLTLTQTVMTSQDALATTQQAQEKRWQDQARTALNAAGVVTKSSGAIVEFTVQNTGSTKLADFADWDVIVEYFQDSGDMVMAWLPYTTGALNDNQWQVAGIYMDAASLSSEVFEPNILDPGEEMVVRLKVEPSVGLTTTNRITLSTANGVTASTIFVR